MMVIRGGERAGELRADCMKPDEPEISLETLPPEEISALLEELRPLLGEAPPSEAEPPPRGVRFEHHVGSGYPLRVVYPDGSWLAVNRASEGLFAGDASGRIVQLLGKDQFRAVSPRQFVAEYERVFGQTLRDRNEAVG
jgi:hypothetical protein